MKNYETIGFIVSSVLGAVATGICTYFTKSIFSVLICLICTILGGWIGKSIKKARV